MSNLNPLVNPHNFDNIHIFHQVWQARLKNIANNSQWICLIKVHLVPRYGFQAIVFLRILALERVAKWENNHGKQIVSTPIRQRFKVRQKRFAITWWCSKGEAMMQTQSQCWAKIYQICNLQFDDGTWCQIPSVPTYLEFMILKLKLNFSRKMSKTSFVCVVIEPYKRNNNIYVFF